jgi:hypothetical protein
MSYPKNLSYAVNRLSGYSTQLVKVRVNQGDTAKSGDVISFDLPYNSIVNLDSIRFCFKVTTAANASFRHTEGFVRQAMWESGGQMISSGFDHTPVLWNIHNDLLAGDKVTSRQLYNRGKNLAIGAISSEEAYVAQFFGLQTAVPQFIDTSLFPNGSVRLSLRLAADGAVLIAAAPTTYTLSDMYLLVQTVDIQDGLYYAVLNERLKAGDIEMPFTNIYSFNGGDRTGTAFDLQFSLSSQSVNLLYGTALPSASEMTNVAATFDTTINNTLYYVRGAQAGTAPLVQWYVNNQSFPSYGQMTAKDAHSETLNAMGLLQDAVGAMNPDMDTATKWEQKFYVSVIRLNHNDGDAHSTLVSGLNALGTNGVGLFKWSQTTSDTVTPVVFVSTTAVIRLGAGRTMAITY